jgi:hypothetical protein
MSTSTIRDISPLQCVKPLMLCSTAAAIAKEPATGPVMGAFIQPTFRCHVVIAVAHRVGTTPRKIGWLSSKPCSLWRPVCSKTLRLIHQSLKVISVLPVCCIPTADGVHCC